MTTVSNRRRLSANAARNDSRLGFALEAAVPPDQMQAKRDEQLQSQRKVNYVTIRTRACLRESNERQPSAKHQLLRRRQRRNAEST